MFNIFELIIVLCRENDSQVHTIINIRAHVRHIHLYFTELCLVSVIAITHNHGWERMSSYWPKGWQFSSDFVHGNFVIMIEGNVFYIATHSTHFIYGYMPLTLVKDQWDSGRENPLSPLRGLLFIYGYMASNVVEDHSDSERGNPLPPHGLLFPIIRSFYLLYGLQSFWCQYNCQ